MALISSFEKITGERQAIHGPVECGWRAFSIDGRKILQLDTYGSAERKFQGKVSQSIQLDEARARELLEIIRCAFPALK